MAKTKFTLEPNPTFKAQAKIPVAGDGFSPVEFVYKFRDRDQFKEFVDTMVGREPVELTLDMACGWDLDEPFDVANISKMYLKYMGAFQAVLDTYFNELTKTSHRAGN